MYLVKECDTTELESSVNMLMEALWLTDTSGLVHSLRRVKTLS